MRTGAIRERHFRCRHAALPSGCVLSVGAFLGTGTKLVAMLLGQARLTGNKMVMSHGSRQELTAMGPFMSALKRGS
jgi:hypothetical protein